MAAALVAALTAGCAGGEPTDTGTGPSPSEPQTTTTSSPSTTPDSVPAGETISLPLDAYVGDADERAAIDRAAGLLVAECMKEKGFHYDPPEVQPRPLTRRQPYGIVDAAQASRYGYHDPLIASGEKKFSDQRPNDAYLIALQGFARPAAPGTTHTGGGCLGEAERKVRGTTTADLDLVGRLAEQAATRTAGDPRVLVAEQAWSACMTRRGFHYTKPSEPLSAPWPATPSAEEIATAQADVSCKAESRLPAIWLTVEAEYQRDLIDQHVGQLAEVKRALEERVRHAREVLEGGR